MTQTRKLYALAVFVALGLSLTAGTSFGVTYYLRADVVSKTMPDGNIIPMWGFASDSAFGAHDGNATVPGPQLVIPPGDSTLTINLENNLPEPVSIVIPGQFTPMTPVKFTDDINRIRIRSFTNETEPNNAAPVAYTWTNLRTGTYMYQSGSHPAVQVQMGLYGPMKKDFAAGVAYDGVAYDKDITLVFSEIAPAIHAAVAANDYGPGKSISSTMEYKPRYFLIDGNAFMPASNVLDAGSAGGNLLLRFINAGIETHVPVLQNLRGNVIAEDGYPFTYAPDQYSINLTAAKTKDLLVVPPANGAYAIYDRRLRLTNDMNAPGGMLAYLVAGIESVSLVISSVTASPDSIVDIQTSQLMVNASDSALLPLVYNWTVPAGAGSLSDATIANPVYTPPDITGVQTYTLTVQVSDSLNTVSGSVDVLVSENVVPVINSVTATPASITDTQTSQLLVDATDNNLPYPLSYHWIVPAGGGSVSDATIPNPVYTPPDINGIQMFTLTVEVSDGYNTVSGTVDILVSGYSVPAVPIQVSKTTIGAGSRSNLFPTKAVAVGKDKITITGLMNIPTNDLNNASTIDVNINSANMVNPLSSEFPVNSVTLKNGKYSLTVTGNGVKKSFKYNSKTQKFTFTASKIDLSGLSCPINVEIKVGDSIIGYAEIGEDVANGKKPVPINLLMGVEDSLRVDKITVKHGKNSDTMSVKGGFAVQDPGVDMAASDFIAMLETQLFTIPANNFKANNSGFKCSKAKLLEGGIATSTFNYKKSTFTMTIKNTKVTANPGNVLFSVEFTGFNEGITVNLD